MFHVYSLTEQEMYRSANLGILGHLILFFHLHAVSLPSRGHKRHCIWHNKTLAYSFWKLDLLSSFPTKHSLALLLKKLSFNQSHQNSSSLTTSSFIKHSLFPLAEGLLVLRNSNLKQMPSGIFSWNVHIEFGIVSLQPCRIPLFALIIHYDRGAFSESCTYLSFSQSLGTVLDTKRDTKSWILSPISHYLGEPGLP